MRNALLLLTLAIVLSACTAPEPTAPPEPTATGPTAIPTFAMPPRLITQAARQRSSWDSAAGNPSVSSDSSVSSKPPAQLPTLALIPTLAPMLDALNTSRVAMPEPPVTPRPTATRSIVLVGELEFFGTDASDAFERGNREFSNGKYEAAINSYQEAKRFHGEPSPALESRIGMAYKWWEKPRLAISYFSSAIGIKDNARDRINRARTYQSIDQCDPAVVDAKVALSMKPLIAPDFHTHVAADYILSWCYFAQWNDSLALQHIDAAIATAGIHETSSSNMDTLIETREFIIQESQQ